MINRHPFSQAPAHRGQSRVIRESVETVGTLTAPTISATPLDALSSAAHVFNHIEYAPYSESASIDPKKLYSPIEQEGHKRILIFSSSTRE